MSGGAVEGVGVHSGRHSRVRLHRDPGPIRFRVGDETLPATPDAVVATPRCTVLGGARARVAMVEHLLAALRVAGFWSDVLVEVEGEELPILDGSAAPWAEAVEALGEPPAAPPALRPSAALRFEHGASRIAWQPGEDRLSVAIDYPLRSIGVQRWSGGPASFRALLAARTFATADEVRALRAAGGLRGAEEGRGIVFTDEGPSAPLRWRDEPVRHKALDALGDTALLGRPLGGRLTIDRGSHAAHVSFMLHLRRHHPPDTSGDRS